MQHKFILRLSGKWVSRHFGIEPEFPIRTPGQSWYTLATGNASNFRLGPLVGETKNDEPRTIPLAGELHQMLLLQDQIRDQKWPDCPWVFFRQGKRIKDFRGAWEEAGTRAGLWNDEAGKPKHIFHDLRRTGARNLVRAGVPERVVPAIGGWRTRSVFERYNIVSERDLHEAAAKLERHLAELEKPREGATSGQLPDSGEISAVSC